MSIIVDFMVIAKYEDKAMEEVNRALAVADSERHQQFQELSTDQAGGTKFFTTPVWAAAFNHLLPETVREAICRADWDEPDEALIIEASGDFEIPLRSRTVAELRAAIPSDERGDNPD